MNDTYLMIIDDDPDDLFIFCEAMRIFATKVNCIDFIHAEEALSFLEIKTNIIPNWIFIDINMPKINGMDCLKKIKKLDHLKQVPVIMYSTSSAKADISESKALGADGYIVKPDSYQKIYEEVSKWVH